jgi:nitrite transporter NirC
MPIPVPEALDDAGGLATAKAAQVRSPLKYLVSSALAGAFVGIAVVLLVSVSGPLLAAASPWTKLVQGAVFGIALTLVVFAGAELFTGNVMVMIQGLIARVVTPVSALAVLVGSLVGNLVGSVLLAAAVHGGGTLVGPGEAMVAKVVAAKDAASGPQLFWRSVLCNMLVCLALWMAARTRSDGAKLAVLWWALLAFIASGFEHSVANMTVFSLGVFEGTATWGQLARNLLWTVPGNIVGGGLLVGGLYAWIGRPAAVAAAVVGPAPATPGSNGNAPAPTAPAEDLQPVPG